MGMTSDRKAFGATLRGSLSFFIIKVVWVGARPFSSNAHLGRVRMYVFF